MPKAVFIGDYPSCWVTWGWFWASLQLAWGKGWALAQVRAYSYPWWSRAEVKYKSLCHWPSVGELPEPLDSQGLECVHSSFIHSFNKISLLTLCLGVSCCLHITGSLSRAGVSWPTQPFLPLPFSMGRSRWREVMSTTKCKVRWRGGAARGHGVGDQSAQTPLGIC